MEESPAAETDWVRTALRRPLDPVPRFVVRATSSGLTDLEREALHGWRRWTATPTSRTILFLFAFSKTERDDLSASQKPALRHIIEAEYP